MTLERFIKELVDTPELEQSIARCLNPKTAGLKFDNFMYKAFKGIPQCFNGYIIDNPNIRVCALFRVYTKYGIRGFSTGVIAITDGEKVYFVYPELQSHYRNSISEEWIQEELIASKEFPKDCEITYVIADNGLVIDNSYCNVYTLYRMSYQQEEVISIIEEEVESYTILNKHIGFTDTCRYRNIMILNSVNGVFVVNLLTRGITKLNLDKTKNFVKRCSIEETPRGIIIRVKNPLFSKTKSYLCYSFLGNNILVSYLVNPKKN